MSREHTVKLKLSLTEAELINALLREHLELMSNEGAETLVLKDRAKESKLTNAVQSRLSTITEAIIDTEDADDDN